MPKLFLSFSLLVFLSASSATAQVQDSIMKLDDIVAVLKLKKKGLLPFAFKPGTTVTEIKSGMSPMEIFKEDSSYVTYTLYFSNDKYDFGDITFDFLEGKVTGVSIETYFASKESAIKGMNLLKKQFDKLYKPGEYSDHTLRWKYSKKGINLWIEMEQVEFEADNGFVLDFYTAEPAD